MLSYWLNDNKLDRWTGWSLDWQIEWIFDWFNIWLVDCWNDSYAFWYWTSFTVPHHPSRLLLWLFLVSCQANSTESWLADLDLFCIFKWSKRLRFTEACRKKCVLSCQYFNRCLFYTCAPWEHTFLAVGDFSVFAVEWPLVEIVL